VLAGARNPNPGQLRTNRGDEEGGAAQAATRAVSGAATAAKVGRNDPCPCGSGKKYKKCHGAIT
jgi:preprotein translocase subunit SecA